MSDTIKQTLLFGCSISSFTTRLGFNQEVGQLEVVLYPDPATGTKTYYSKYNSNFTAIEVFADNPQTTNAPDSLQAPPVGSPVFFQMGAFKWAGCLQSILEERSESANPAYRVTLVDPRIILSQVELIIGSYTGNTNYISNLFNCYGFWEDTNNPAGGFGFAQVNDLGMPSTLIQEAAQLISVNPFSNIYGGPGINILGWQYRLDLTKLPIMPVDYRISGNSINLLDFVEQVCRDAGCDVYAGMTFDGSNNPIIYVVPIFRTVQLQLNQIHDWIASQPSGTVSESQVGTELRAEMTSSFLVGEAQHNLFLQYGNYSSGIYNKKPNLYGNEQSQTIIPYWGTDTLGNAIVGRGNPMSNEHNFDVFTGLLGIPNFPQTYNITVGELRAASQGFDMWTGWLEVTKPDILDKLQIDSAFMAIKLLNALKNGVQPNANDLRKAGPKPVFVNNNRFEEGHNEMYYAEMLYQFVYKYSNEYYGKKFQVIVPQVAAKLLPDTNKIIYSDEPTDGAFFNGLEPLGLPVLYQDIFQLEDSRFTPFMHFYPSGQIQPLNPAAFQQDQVDNEEEPGIPPLTNDRWVQVNISELSPDTAIVSLSGAFVQGELEPYLVFLNWATLTSPRAVITLAGRLLKFDPSEADKMDSIVQWLQKANNTSVQLGVGDSNDFVDVQPSPAGDNFPVITTVTEKGKNLLRPMLNDKANGSVPQFLSPMPIMPDAAAIPLRSNTKTYGPWYLAGAPGKVSFEQNNALAPWKYGGFDGMNIAGNAQIAQKATSLQISERGTLTVPGLPTLQLGESITFGGPQITSVDVQIGVDGVKTTYILQTYTDRFGYLAKSYLDKFNKITENTQEEKRNFLSLTRAINLLASQSSTKTGTEPAKGESAAVQKDKTPHETLIGYVNPTTKRPSVSSLTTLEALGGLHLAEPSGYDSTAMASLDTVLFPFSYFPSSLTLPAWGTPSGNATIPTCVSLNPIVASGGGQQTCQQLLTWGTGTNVPDSYQPTDPSFDPGTARGIGIRFPMIGVGFGYDVNGNPVPAASGGSTFASGYLNDPTMWKAGPVDFRWDDSRKVWVTTSSIQTYVVVAQSGYMSLMAGSGAINDPSSSRPRYVVRPVTGIDKFGNLSYVDTTANPPMGPSGLGPSIDKFAFNLQENIGELWALDVGSPVILYNQYGQNFFNELPRTFAKRLNY